MSTSKTMYIYYKRSLEPIFQVTFDRDDGAVETVRLYDDLGSKWTVVDLESLSKKSLDHIELCIADELEGMKEHWEEVRMDEMRDLKLVGGE